MQKKIVFIIGALLYMTSAYFSYAFFSNQTGGSGFTSPISEKATIGQKSTLEANQEEPKTEECPLNGELLPKSYRKIWEGRRPLGVMIENHTDARPQSGLSSADVVYEAVAEGGITRFLAMFYCKDAPFIGPVRSARMYFMHMLAQYGEYPLYAHVGGANTPGPADALGMIRKLNWDGYNDLNQFSVPFPVYARDYERLPNRVTEHTMYSSTQKLWDYAATKRELTNVDRDGNQWDRHFRKLQFKSDTPSSADVTSISFDFWQGKSDYGVTWNYDATGNNYKRANGGSPHVDKNTDKPLTAKNVVIVFMKESPANDGYPGGHRLYKTTGDGKAVLFQDGTAIKGSWSKKDMFSPLIITDSSGKEVAFNRGQIFFEIVPEGNSVKY